MIAWRIGAVADGRILELNIHVLEVTGSVNLVRLEHDQPTAKAQHNTTRHQHCYDAHHMAPFRGRNSLSRGDFDVQALSGHVEVGVPRVRHGPRHEVIHGVRLIVVHVHDVRGSVGIRWDRLLIRFHRDLPTREQVQAATVRRHDRLL